MKFVANEDIAAPIETVWAQVSDLSAFEVRARDRVGPVRRTPPGPPGEGTEWTGRATIMGKARDISVTATRLSAPTHLAAAAGTEGMAVTLEVVLTELAPRRTRLTVTSEAKARSLAARLMLQSAKLARTSLVQRYKQRVANFAARVERDAALS